MPIDTSTLISVLALLVSVVAAATGALSVRTSRAALRASQERFVKEGPMLEIRTMYTYGAPPHDDELIGLDAEVRNAGRTPTIITAVGLHDDEGGYDNVVEDELGVGATRRYNFDVAELASWIGHDLNHLRFVVGSGHGGWDGEHISRDVVNELRAAIRKDLHGKG